MPRYVFDCETNGLLEELDRLHCLCFRDMDSGENYSCTDNAPGKHPSIIEGLKLLEEAELLVGHNVITFDIPAIQKVYPWWKPKGVVRDTLVCTRLIWTELRQLDWSTLKVTGLPPQLVGRHSLEAWGYRTGLNKGTFGKTTDWGAWSPEMQTYCDQDVEVTAGLWEHILKNGKPSTESLNLEHDFQQVIRLQVEAGFPFDEKKAIALYGELVGKREVLAGQLRDTFAPWWAPAKKTKKGEVVTWAPKANSVKHGYVAGAEMCKIKLVEFNPASRAHIVNRLKALHGWQPEVLTDKGEVRLDEDIMSTLPYPEAPLLAEYLMVDKRIGQIAEGKEGWLRHVKNGRIHGQVNTNGACTGRCTHFKPNVAQTPSTHNKKGVVPYGKECRELWYAPPGWLLVGADASGLELRMLSHYMAKYDDGAYGRIVVGGDIHTMNQQAAGLPSRDNAKTFIYAYLYGAGDEKLGSIVLPRGTKEEKIRAGRKLRKQFLQRLPALRFLKEAVEKAASERHYLRGLDGRYLYVRSMRAAVNTLLQSAGAIIMKKATTILYDILIADGLVWGEDWVQVAHIHDEIQNLAREGLEVHVGEAAVAAIRQAGDYFGCRCPLDGEFKVGHNWAETH